MGGVSEKCLKLSKQESVPPPPFHREHRDDLRRNYLRGVLYRFQPIELRREPRHIVERRAIYGVDDNTAIIRRGRYCRFAELAARAPELQLQIGEVNHSFYRYLRCTWRR